MSFFSFGPWAIIHGVAKLANPFYLSNNYEKILTLTVLKLWLLKDVSLINMPCLNVVLLESVLRTCTHNYTV